MFLLWFFVGVPGGHRLYVGKTGSALLYFFTAGFFFIGWITDLFKLGSMVDDYNMRYRMMNGAANNNTNTNTNTNNNNIVINMTAPGASAPVPPAPAPAPAPQNEQAGV